MGNSAALQTVWATLSGTTAQKLTAINAMTAPGPPQDIQISTLQDFLTTNNLLTPITAYVSNGGPQSVQSSLIACNYIIAILSAIDPTIHASIPANFAAIQQLGPGLLADPGTGVTPQSLAAMMALITPPAPWWQVNGFAGPITITELIAAGNLF
jgi:hypothetical protein